MSAASKEENIKRNLAWVYGRNKEEAKHDPDKRSIAPTKRFVDVDAIRTFEAGFECLDPAFQCTVYLPDELLIGQSALPYPSYEHALQATRVSDVAKRNEIRNVSTAREAKKIAAKAGSHASAEWKEKCVRLATSIIRDKFIRGKQLTRALMETGQRSILYTPSFGDLFWGVDQNDRGQNHYGKILESIREEIRRGDDLMNWIRSYCSLIDKDAVDMGVIVEKDRKNIEEDCKKFTKKNILFIGKDDGMDIVATHASISRRHSFVYGDKRAGLCIVDISSANGTKIQENGRDTPSLLPFIPYPIKNSTPVFLGASTRTYFFELDTLAFEKRRLDLYSRLADNDSNGSHGEDDTTAFVGNLAPDISEQDLREFFEGCGGIKKISIPLNRTTQKPRGIAFVTLTSTTALLQAVARDKDILLGNKIRVKKSSDSNDQNAVNCHFSGSSKNKICYAYLIGNCTRGDNCRYSHDASKDSSTTMHSQNLQDNYDERRHDGRDESKIYRKAIYEPGELQIEGTANCHGGSSEGNIHTNGACNRSRSRHRSSSQSGSSRSQRKVGRSWSESRSRSRSQSRIHNGRNRVRNRGRNIRRNRS